MCATPQPADDNLELRLCHDGEAKKRVTSESVEGCSEAGSAAPSESCGDASSDLDNDAALAEFLSQHGLARCSRIRLLGVGAAGSVDLVHISPPDAVAGGSGGIAVAPLAAARKTLSRSKDPHLRSREDALFSRELEGLNAGSSCPFMVRQLGIAEYDDRLELLLELAEGDTLEHELSTALSSVPAGLLRQPLLAPARMANVAASLFTALAVLHDQGFAHLDVKPANLLLTAEGRLMLGDAGCTTRTAADGTLPAPLAFGTPVFTAPEARAPHGAFSASKADCYAVGVLLAVCCAWHRQTGRVLAFLRGEVALPACVPEELRDLVTRLVAKDPAERPSAREALAHPFLAGVDVHALAPLRCAGVPPR